MVNEPSTRPYFWGGTLGGWLINYDYRNKKFIFYRLMTHRIGANIENTANNKMYFMIENTNP